MTDARAGATGKQIAVFRATITAMTEATSRIPFAATVVLLLAGCPDDSTPADSTDDTSTGDADSSATAPTTTTASTTTASTTASTTETADSSETTTPDPDSSESTSPDPDTSSSSSTGTPECEASTDCGDPLLPICDDGTCIACTAAADGDADCAARDPAVPACGADGACVQCTETNASACTDTTPVCDTAASACVGCTFHEQCDDACDIATGACFTGDCVIEIDGTTTIAENVADGCVLRIHALEGGAAYQETLSLSGITIALIAADGELPRLDAALMPEDSPTLAIIDAANVYMQGLFVLGNSRGVDAAGANVWLDRMHVIDGTGGGVAVSGGASATIRNSVIAGGNDTAALSATDATLDVLYSTIVGAFGTASSLACTDDVTIDVRNSLLVTFGDDPEIACTTDTFDNNLTEVELGEPAPNWFVNVNGGDYHLTENTPAMVLSAGEWHQGDPLVDLDGDLRPTLRGSADVVGADVP
jgi:hypothetical protein